MKLILTLIWLQIAYLLPPLGQKEARASSASGGIEEAKPSRPWMRPRPTINTPNAFGARWGTVFFGAGFQETTRMANIADGTAFAGFGIGDSRSFPALETTITAVDLDPFGTDGTISFKLHWRVFEQTSVAVGRENAIRWGTTDGGQSYFLTVGHILQLRSEPRRFLDAITLQAGIGDGRFRTRAAHLAQETQWNLFASASLRVFDPIALNVNWTGQDLFAGVALAPFRDIPLFMTLAFADLAGTERATKQRFITGIAYGDSFFKGESPFRNQ